MISSKSKTLTYDIEKESILIESGMKAWGLQIKCIEGRRYIDIRRWIRFESPEIEGAKFSPTRKGVMIELEIFRAKVLPGIVEIVKVID